MPDKYVTRTRLKVGASTVAPGTDVTSTVVKWRTLRSYINSGKIVLVRTLTHHTFRAKQHIPESVDKDWHLRPYRRLRRDNLDPVRYRGPRGEGGGPITAYYPTSATAGTPGSWTSTPAYNTLPADAIAANNHAIVASPATAWTTGQYVAGSGANMYWNGTTWTSGIAP
jgi:hypothetical protein